MFIPQDSTFTGALRETRRTLTGRGYVAILLTMRGLSVAAVGVLQAVANGFEYGFDVIDATGLPSGTVYPALGRLERDGLVRSAWEEQDSAFAQGRPARRYYRVTAAGQRALAEARERLRALLPGLRPARGRG
jgi:DNA-binding MarR family transcriptional regulator